MKQATHVILEDCFYFKKGEEVFLVRTDEDFDPIAYKWQSVKPSRGYGQWWMSDLSNVAELTYQLEND